jgi:hypothetical protein
MGFGVLGGAPGVALPDGLPPMAGLPPMPGVPVLLPVLLWAKAAWMAIGFCPLPSVKGINAIAMAAMLARASRRVGLRPAGGDTSLGKSMIMIATPDWVAFQGCRAQKEGRLRQCNAPALYESPALRQFFRSSFPAPDSLAASSCSLYRPRTSRPAGDAGPSTTTWRFEGSLFEWRAKAESRRTG